MAVSYNKLWKLLVDKKMSKATIQAKFRGKRIAHGYFKHGKPTRSLLRTMDAMKKSETTNTAVQMKEQQTR